MPQTAPKTINPESKWFVIKPADSKDDVVGKFDTNAAVKIPENVGDFVVVELSDRESLDNYAYSRDIGFQT